jgi:hypothetical protein
MEKSRDHKSGFTNKLAFAVICMTILLVHVAVQDEISSKSSKIVNQSGWFTDGGDMLPWQKDAVKSELKRIHAALNLHDSGNRPLIGYSLDPLRGRYLVPMPVDPWGNDYNVDSDAGLLICFGADGQAGGLGMNEDTCLYYKPSLSIRRVQYHGPWGIPQKDSEIIMTMNRPFSMTSNDTILDTLHVLTDLNKQAVPDSRKGAPVSFREMNLRGEIPPQWRCGGYSEEKTRPWYHNPENGILSLYNGVTARGINVQQITPTMAMNFDVAITPSVFGAEYGIVETSCEGGPLTTAIYGAETVNYYRAPVPVPLYNGENRGVKIERF